MAGNTLSKIYVKLDDRNSFWIISENGKVTRSPSKYDLERAKLVSYSTTNICPRCREEYEKTKISELEDKCILYPRNVDHETDINGKKTKEWICRKHGRKSYQRYSPNSQNNVLRSVADIRTGNLTDHTKLLGNNCEELTEKWLGAERLSVKYDRYSHLPLDHGPITKHISIMVGDKFIDIYGKVPQTKGKCYNDIYGWAGGLEDDDKEFDILILYCFNTNGKKIERIYILPKDVVNIRHWYNLNPTDAYGKRIIDIYEKYRINDEDEIKKVNNLYQQIL